MNPPLVPVYLTIEDWNAFIDAGDYAMKAAAPMVSMMNGAQQENLERLKLKLCNVKAQLEEHKRWQNKKPV